MEVNQSEFQGRSAFGQEPKNPLVGSAVPAVDEREEKIKQWSTLTNTERCELILSLNEDDKGLLIRAPQQNLWVKIINS
jgi:hypothetical protein